MRASHTYTPDPKTNNPWLTRWAPEVGSQGRRVKSEWEAPASSSACPALRQSPVLRRWGAGAGLPCVYGRGGWGDGRWGGACCCAVTMTSRPHGNFTILPRCTALTAGETRMVPLSIIHTLGEVYRFACVCVWVWVCMCVSLHALSLFYAQMLASGNAVGRFKEAASLQMHFSDSNEHNTPWTNTHSVYHREWSSKDKHFSQQTWSGVKENLHSSFHQTGLHLSDINLHHWKNCKYFKFHLGWRGFTAGVWLGDCPVQWSAEIMGEETI